LLSRVKSWLENHKGVFFFLDHRKMEGKEKQKEKDSFLLLPFDYNNNGLMIA
jgi:hypothetical protein